MANYSRGIIEPTSTLIQRKTTTGTTASGTSQSLSANALDISPTTGNYMVAFFTFSTPAIAPVVTTPTGWTSIGSGTHGNIAFAYAYFRQVVGGDTGAVTLTFTLGTAEAVNYAVNIYELTGCNGTFQFKSAGAASNTQNASLTPGIADCFQFGALIDVSSFTATFNGNFYISGDAQMSGGSEALYTDFLIGPTIYTVTSQTLTSTASAHTDPLLIYILAQLSSNPTQTTDSITQRLVNFNRTNTDTSTLVDTLFRGTVRYPSDTVTTSSSVSRLINFNRLPVTGIFALSQYAAHIDSISSVVNYFRCDDATPGPLTDDITASTLTINGAPSFHQQRITPGPIDYSILFNVSTAYASGTLSNLSSSPFTSASNFSMELWFAFNTNQVFTGTDATPILAGIFNSTSQFAFYIGFLSANNTSLGVYFQDSVSGNATLSANTTINVAGTVNSVIDNIYHVVFTYDGGTQTGTIYVNGVATNSGSLTLPNGLNPGSLLVLATGLTAKANSTARVYMNNVAIYNAVLSPTSVQNHYNQGAGSISSNFTNTALVTGTNNVFTETLSRSLTNNRNNTPYWSKILSDAPTILYRTDESSGITAFDSSGAAQNGTYSTLGGGVPFGVSLHQTGPSIGNFSAFYYSPFNGSMNSSYTPTSTAAWTLELYWSPNAATVANQTIAATTTTTGANTGWWLYTNGSGGISIQVGYNTGSTTISSSTTYTIGTWYHVVLVYSATNLTMYINNQVVATGATAAAFKAQTHIQIGCLPTTGTNHFDGYIGGIAYYNSAALTAPKILDHYNALFNAHTDVFFTSDLLSNYSVHPRSLTDTVTTSDFLSRILNFYRTNSDTSNFSDIFASQNNYTRTIDEAFYYFQSDVISSYSIHDRTAGPDTLTTSDLLERQIDFYRTNTDIFSTTDLITSVQEIFRYFSEALTTTPDEIVFTKEVFRTLTNTFVHTNFLTSQGIYNRTNTDSMTTNASVFSGSGLFVTLFDSLVTSDSIYSQNNYNRNILDALTFSDILSSYKYFDFTLDETFSTSDLIIEKYVLATRFNLDELVTLDILSSQNNYNRNLSDTTSISDAVFSFASLNRMLVDIIFWVYLSTVNGYKLFIRENIDTLITIDFLSRQINLDRALQDVFLTSDQFFRQYELSRGLVDTLEFSDSVNRSATFNRKNTENLQSYDSLIYVNINGYHSGDYVSFSYKGVHGEGTIVETIYDTNKPYNYDYKIQVSSTSDWTIFNGSTSFITDFTELRLISRYPTG